MSSPTGPERVGERLPLSAQWGALLGLWRKFLPLSLSDVAMALGDPLQAMALTRLPQPQTTLAAMGVVKAVANLLESPIIMLLHAATALSASAAARRSLWRFTLLASVVLSSLFATLALPPGYTWLMRRVFGATPEIAATAYPAFLLMIAWPGLIAWRRYFQGLLIRAGQGRCLAWASGGRLLALATGLVAGVLQHAPGAQVAAGSLILGLLVEATLATGFAYAWGATAWPAESEESLALPSTTAGVARYYLPLAFTMLLVWSGRALVIALVARAIDGVLALAVWPTAWAFVILIANSTRMVQQLILAHAHELPGRILLGFALSVGVGASALLAGLAFSSGGHGLLLRLLGGDRLLALAALPVLQWGSLVPLLVALQNALQGWIILAGRNWQLQWATAGGLVVTLGLTGGLVVNGNPGGLAAILGILAGLAVEVALLASRSHGIVTWDGPMGPSHALKRK